MHREWVEGIERMGSTWEQLGRRAQNRVGQRNLVGGLCSITSANKFEMSEISEICACNPEFGDLWCR